MTNNLRDEIFSSLDLLNDGVYYTDFSLKLNLSNHVIPLKTFSNLWKDIADRGIKVSKVFAIDESPCYFIQLPLKNNNHYLREQLNDILDNF